jgi:hypothetical protein
MYLSRGVVVVQRFIDFFCRKDLSRQRYPCIIGVGSEVSVPGSHHLGIMMTNPFFKLLPDLCGLWYNLHPAVVSLVQVTQSRTLCLLLNTFRIVR